MPASGGEEGEDGTEEHGGAGGQGGGRGRRQLKGTVEGGGREGWRRKTNRAQSDNDCSDLTMPFFLPAPSHPSFFYPPSFYCSRSPPKAQLPGTTLLWI